MPAPRGLRAAFSYNSILKGGHAISTQPGYMPGLFHAMTKEESISMADDKKIPGQHEQAPPAVPGKPEATVPVTGNPGQVTRDGTTTPVDTDKPKTNPPDKEAPAGEQKTEPKKNDGKVIEIDNNS